MAKQILLGASTFPKGIGPRFQPLGLIPSEPSTMSLKERFQTRIPSIPAYLRRVAADRRRLSYDLLPLASTPAARARIARLVALTRPKTPGFQPSDAARS